MMDEEETRNCPNCKREIPAVNFTIHTVHCARNIRVCPVCKEPVPSAELDEHHQKFHKLLPCKQCGESVCGTDLEDHIRDSCSNTIKTCRFCDLELPRRELPSHESYCGVRTEQCADCKEWVMIKYRQLHLDSNHGFIRLDDDPAPTKKEFTKKMPLPTIPLRSAGPARQNVPANATPELFNSALNSNSVVKSAANSRPKLNVGTCNNVDGAGSRPNSSAPSGPARPTSIFDEAGPSSFSNDFPRTQVRYLGSSNSGSSASSASVSPQDGSSSGSRPINNGVKKRTNDQPQININKEVVNKVTKDLPISRGAVKKRPAPKPPRAASSPRDPRRDLAYYSAMQRQQREDRDRAQQNQYNLAHGLPPVLNPAAKLEKLRKMDALHNRETEDTYRDRRRSPGPVDRSGPVDRPGHINRVGHSDRPRPDRRNELQNLQPMSPEQFMARFSELQLRGGAGEGRGAEGGEDGGGDRFREIKSSLRELRRGLNEVTAPYNNNNNNAINNNDRARPPTPREEVQLPCEFCNLLVAADDLVQHQTGCRPDLAQYWGRDGLPSPPASHSPSPGGSPAAGRDPVIPCEFCAQSLPVYLITEHQERCAREVDILSAD